MLLATLFAADLPGANAQVGRLINRARTAVGGAGAAVAQAVDRPPRPAEGAPAPALDLVSLLDTQFYPAHGSFGVGDFFLIFPPQGLVERDRIQGQFLIRDASGGAVVRTTIGQASATGSAAIVTLQTTAGVVGDVNNAVEPGGSYTMDVELYGDVVGSMPFTVTRSSNGDPYDPVTTIALDGPWRTHAYFEHEVERPESQMHFHAWVAPDDMPSNQVAEVSVRRGGQEVAWGHAYAQLAHGWGHTEFDLYTPESRDDRFGRHKANRTLWTIQDVTPGPYEIVLSSEAGPFRTFAIHGAAGAFVPHPRSAIEYEPRKHFLGTRRLSGQNLDRQHHLYWIAPPVE